MLFLSNNCEKRKVYICGIAKIIIASQYSILFFTGEFYEQKKYGQFVGNLIQ